MVGQFLLRLRTIRHQIELINNKPSNVTKFIDITKQDSFVFTIILYIETFTRTTYN